MNVIRKKVYMIIQDKTYLDIVEDIVNHDEFIKLKKFWHHSSSIFEHCVRVSYESYRIGKKLNLDYVSLARGGLLHDFFLYDWREDRFRDIRNFGESHAFRHPRIALENAEKYFALNEREKDIISKHMWPATIIPPRYKESYVVTMVDKYIAGREYTHARKSVNRPEKFYFLPKQIYNN